MREAIECAQRVLALPGQRFHESSYDESKHSYLIEIVGYHQRKWLSIYFSSRVIGIFTRAAARPSDPLWSLAEPEYNWPASPLPPESRPSPRRSLDRMDLPQIADFSALVQAGAKPPARRPRRSPPFAPPGPPPC